MSKLEAAARTPEQLGVNLTEHPNGSILIEHAKKFSGAQQAVLPLYSKPFRKIRVPIVRININDRDTYVLLDTGSSSTLIDYWGSERMNVTPFGPPFIRRPVQSLGGSSELILALVKKIQFGEIALRKVPVGIHNDARDAGSHLWLDGFRIEGILGNDVLSSFSYVQIDFSREQIVLGRTRYEADKQRWLGETPLILRFGVPVMLAHLDGNPLHVAFDTGLDMGLLLPRSTAQQLELPELDEAADIHMGESLGGQTVYKRIQPRTLTLLDLEFQKIPTIINMIQMEGGDSPYALLGTEVMKKYVITLDYASKKIIFEKP